MALVVFLRGVNVGGHRRFRPADVARRLQHMDAVNIGAAGTFVIRRRVTRAAIRLALGAVLPFEAAIAICDGKDIVRLTAREPFSDVHAPSGVVRFVSILTGRPRATPSLPLTLPSKGPWLLKVLSQDGRFILGIYRRHMKVIGYLGSLDRLFGASVTTRNWSTITAIARVLEGSNQVRHDPRA